MNQNRIRLLVGIGVGCFAIATLVGWVIARLTDAVLINDNPLSIGALYGVMLAIFCFAVALVGAIVRLGQLRQWGWFGALLMLTIFALPLGMVIFLLYLFIGPDSEGNLLPYQLS